MTGERNGGGGALSAPIGQIAASQGANYFAVTGVQLSLGQISGLPAYQNLWMRSSEIKILSKLKLNSAGLT